MEKNGRMIVVTGVSQGLGRALVDRFIDQGHQLVGVARSAAAIEELRQTYRKPHDFSVLDVVDHPAVDTWAQRIIDQFGAPDLVVNNAALINRNAPLWEVPVQEFSDLIDVNLKGVFHVMRAFLPGMLAAGRGVIANFSSGWGRSPSAEVAPYCCSKWGLEGLTQSLAQELPSGLAAVPVNPGIINTPMLQSCFGGNASSFPSAQEWAKRAVPFLLALSAKDNGKPLSI